MLVEEFKPTTLPPPSLQPLNPYSQPPSQPCIVLDVMLVILEWKICAAFAHSIRCVERALLVLVLQIVIRREILYTPSPCSYFHFGCLFKCV